MTTTVVGVVRVIGGGTSEAGREISLTVTGFALAMGAGAAPGAAPLPGVVMPGMFAGMRIAAEALGWLAAARTSTVEVKSTATVMIVKRR